MKITGFRTNAYSTAIVVLCLFKVLECTDQSKSLPNVHSGSSTEHFLDSKQEYEKGSNLEAFRNLKKEFLDLKAKLISAILEKKESIDTFKTFCKKIDIIFEKIEARSKEITVEEFKKYPKEAIAFVNETRFMIGTKGICEPLTSHPNYAGELNFNFMFDWLKKYMKKRGEISTLLFLKLKNSTESSTVKGHKKEKIAFLTLFKELDTTENLNITGEKIKGKVAIAKFNNMVEIIGMIRLKAKIFSESKKSVSESALYYEPATEYYLRELICLDKFYNTPGIEKLQASEIIEMVLSDLKETINSLCLYACSYLSINNCNHEARWKDVKSKNLENIQSVVNKLFCDLPGSKDKDIIRTDPGNLKTENTFLRKCLFYLFEKACLDYHFLTALEALKSEENKKLGNPRDELDIFKNHILKVLTFFTSTKFFEFPCEYSLSLESLSCYDFNKEISDLVDNLKFLSKEKTLKLLDSRISDVLVTSYRDLSKEEQDKLPDDFLGFMLNLCSEISKEILKKLPSDLLPASEFDMLCRELEPSDNILRKLLQISDENERMSSLNAFLNEIYEKILVLLDESRNAFKSLKKKKEGLFNNSRSTNLSNFQKEGDSKRLKDEVCRLLKDRKEKQDAFLKSVNKAKSFLADVFKFYHKKDEIIQNLIESPYDLEIKWCEEAIRALELICEKAGKAEEKKQKEALRRNAKKQAEEELRQDNNTGSDLAANNPLETLPSNQPSSSKSRNKNEMCGSGCSKKFKIPNANHKKANKYSNQRQQPGRK